MIAAICCLILCACLRADSPVIHLVSPDDEADIADGLRRLLTDGELKSALRQRGLTHAAQFTWERAARQTIEVYRQAMALDDMSSGDAFAL